MRWFVELSVTVGLLHMIQYSSSQKDWCNKTFTRQFETVYFSWYRSFGNENCTWTFNPPTPEATCFMISINRVNFRNQSAVESNLLLPDNVDKIDDSFGISDHSCRIYSKSVDYVYSPKSWAPSECNTTTVIKEWPPRIKMKLYDTRMLLNYAFLNCKNTTRSSVTPENEQDQMSIKFIVAFACSIVFGALLVIRFIYDCFTFLRKRHSNTTTNLNQDDAEPEGSFKCQKQEAVYELADKSPDAELVDNVLYHQYGGGQDV